VIDTTTTHTRIIVPLDGGQVAERAIPVAAALAAPGSFPLTFVTVLSESDMEDNAATYLKAQADALPGRQVEYDVLWRLPAVDTLVEYLHHHPDSLVCCSTHARLDSTTSRLGSVAEALVRRAPVPVLLVGPQTELPGPEDRYEDLVVCVEDDSAYRLVPCVRALSESLALHPTLLQVSEPSYGAGRSAENPQTALLASLSREFAVNGEEAAWELIEDRNVPLAITTFSRQRATPLLALSSRRRYPEERYEDASVTVAIARLTSSPVLVVGPAVTVTNTRR
jgi:nucleotide-binding universal stress UspA family protein